MQELKAPKLISETKFGSSSAPRSMALKNKLATLSANVLMGSVDYFIHMVRAKLVHIKKKALCCKGLFGCKVREILPFSAITKGSRI